MDVYLTYKHGIDWTIHDLLLELTHYLKDAYEANIHYEQGKCQKLKEFEYQLPDCEIVIYDKERDVLKAISYSEGRTMLWNIFQERNNPKDVLVVLHQDEWGLRNVDRTSFKFSLKRTTFYSYLPSLNMNYFYNKRKTIPYFKRKDRMFFRCTTGRGDEIALSEIGIINELFPPIPIEEYLLKAIEYRVGLSLPGAAELCHRDLEYMGIGLPMLRMEYTQEYSPNFIPNYHYIAVDRGNLPNDPNLDLRGGPEYREKYISRYNEVKEDYEFLEFISKNAYRYYQENCTPHTRLPNIVKIIGL